MIRAASSPYHECVEQATVGELSLVQQRLNTACPYFTMFPLSFPLDVLRAAAPTDRVLDPFCGRGTTLFAARTLGLYSAGVDASPVAAAIAASKVAEVTVDEVLAELGRV